MSEPPYWRIRRKKAEKDQETAERKRNETEQSADRNKIIETLERGVKDIETARDQIHADHKTSISWERRRFWVDIIGTVGLWAAAGVGLIAICVSSIDAGHQRTIMHDQQMAMQGQLTEMQTQQRAWVHITPYPDGKATFDANGLTVPVRVVFENTGHSPALRVFLDVQVAAFESNPGYITRQKQECASDRELMTKNIPGYSEFPGQQLITSTGNNISWADLRKLNVPLGKTILFLYGCVTYMSAGDAEIHQTGFAYQVLAVYPGVTGVFNIPDTNDVVASQEFILRLPPTSASEFAN